ncbi:MAG: hypothetical protein K5899_06500 [Bacteroidaceae bacterium]|nr:hypothetical protein [Bacteroidaceae bacterium]
MRKRLLLLFLSLVGLCTNIMAQKWIVKEHEADALKKQKAYTSYKFEDANENAFVYWTWSLKDGDFRIVNSSQQIFDYNDKRIMEITIGFYDNQDNLLEKTKTRMKVEEDPQFASVLNVLSNKTCKKVIKFLNEQEGYVRIIAPLYLTATDFDIKVLCHKSCENL